MKAVSLILAALLLVGCEGGYRYPCQDPANKDREECNRPACEAEGYCYDTLNGLPPEQSETQVEQVEETPAAPAADCNCEQKGE